MTKISFLVLSLFLLFGCSNTESTKETILGNVEDVEIQYAENFKLKKVENGYLLELLDPATKEIDQTYTINPEKNKKIISLTSTLNGMLAILESQDLLVGISDKSHIYDSKIMKLYRKGQIKEYGDQSRNSVEKIVASKASIIFYDIVDEKFPNQEKLKKFGVNVMPIYDWRENHPLAKAEWIKVVGAITGKMKEANEFFDEVDENYNSLQELGRKFDQKPTVLCGNLIGDVWYTPSGGNYFAMLIKDAGGQYKYENTKGTISLGLTIEQILKDNLETEYWLNPGFKKKSLILKMNPHVKHLGAFNNNVFCYSKGMKKFWEQSAARPDLVLSDLIHIFHPEEKSIKKSNFYKKIH